MKRHCAALVLFAAIVVLVACQGGSLTVPPNGGSQSPWSVSAQSSVACPAATTEPLPSSHGFGGTVTFSTSCTPATTAQLTFTLQNFPPTDGTPALANQRVLQSARRILSLPSHTTIVYLSVTSSEDITLPAGLQFSIQVPSFLVGSASFYIVFFDPTVNDWVVYSGPAAVNGNTLTFTTGNPLTLKANVRDWFALISTASPIPSPTSTPSPTPTPVCNTCTPPPTPTASPTPTPLCSGCTPAPTPTPTPVGQTPTPTPPGQTPTPTPTVTSTPTPTPVGQTPTPTPTVTPRPTPTPVGQTPSPTPTRTPTPTASPASTPSPSPTATRTPTPAPTPTLSPTATPTSTPTATPVPGSLNASPNPVNVNGAGSTYAQTVTVSESPYPATDTFTESDDCNPNTGTIATVTPTSSGQQGSPETWSVTGINSGQCDATFKDAFGQMKSVHIVVTITGFHINTVTRR